MTGELPPMRASDAERERVAEALREAVAEGRLTMEEFEERLELAYTARTHADLEPLVRDLPVPASMASPAPRPSRAPAGADASWAERIGGSATSRWGLAVMGGFQRAGRWVMPRAFTSVVVMGGGEIDLRDARFEERDVVVRCFALMGGISVIVPPDVEVHVNGVGIMGGFDQAATGDGAPEAPRVTVTGLAIWGAVVVERKRRKADVQREKEARRREKAELKRLRKEREAERELGRTEQRLDASEREPDAPERELDGPLPELGGARPGIGGLARERAEREHVRREERAVEDRRGAGERRAAGGAAGDRPDDAAR